MIALRHRAEGLCRPASWLVAGGLIMLVMLVAGCGSTVRSPADVWDWKGPVPSGYYLVRRGDTLSQIAQRKRIPMHKLARMNGLKPPYRVYAGRLIRVGSSSGSRSTSRTRSNISSSPAGSRFLATASGPSRKTAPAKKQPVVLKRDTASGAPGSRRKASGVPWAWPIEGPVKQRFSGADRTRQGLRIGCRPGQAVKASAAGLVVYSGSGLKGYGNLIIVKHNDKYLSAYGFNRRLLVREDDKVARGQTVAECGRGPDDAYLLHFEVRRHGTAVDPIFYLPPRG